MKGTIDYDKKEKRWVIQCEPHIAIRLKRWFGKLGRASAKYYHLADTTETARDLQMFCDRFGISANGYGDYLTARAGEHKDMEKVILSVLDGTVQVEGFELAVPARDYQKIGAQLALKTRGVLIADDLGLGKTCIAIAMLTKPETLPALVVTMAHLPRQWQRELKKFAPNLQTHILKSTKPYDYNSLGSVPNQIGFYNRTDVVIANYHKLAGWVHVLSSGAIKTVIFDECQELRRAESEKYKAARAIAQSAEYRLGLSATPIYNYGGEFYNIYECLAPGRLGAKSEFLTEWCGSSYADDKAKIGNPKAFGAYLRSEGLMLRRTREEVGLQLPPLTKVPHHIEADLAQLKEVSASCAELARFILGLGGNFAAKEKNIVGAEFNNKLRQATGIAKAPFIAEFVRMVVESGEPVMVGAWHREVYAILLDKLKDLRPVMFTGTESAMQKEEAVRKFVAGETKIFIMSLRSGAGLDGLQGHCRTGIIAELDWSPAVHEQFFGRFFRPGQKERSVGYYLISDYGSDPTIVDILGLKKEQSEGVIELRRNVAETQVDPDYVKKLATAYLKQIG